MNNLLVAIATALALSASGPGSQKKKPAPVPAAPPAVAPAPAAPVSGEGREVRSIPLSDKQAQRVHLVKTAPSYPVTIEFPEAFNGEPICGDCIAGKDLADAKGKASTLFIIDVSQPGHYLTIKPRVFAGRQPDGTDIPAQDIVTSLTVRLQTYTLTIQVEYTDDPRQADPRVVFTLPDRPKETAYVAAEIEKARKKLEEEMIDKLQRSVTTEFLQVLLESHRCNPISPRERSQDIVVEAKELCVFGSRYFIRFQVENRGRETTDIADLTLRAGPNKKALSEIPDPEQLFSNHHLEFSAVTQAIAGYRLDEGQAPPRVFELTVHERGGRGRSVRLTFEP